MIDISRTFLRRTATGISAAALTLGATLALAPAANALPSSGVIEVFKVGTVEVDVTGTDNAENVLVDLVDGKFRVTRNSGPALVAGSGCTQIVKNDVVECAGTIKTVRVDLFGGKDKAENDTSIFTAMFGGRGDDILIGGTGADKLNGGLDTDTIQGRGGVDTCFGEVKSSCEK